MDIRIGIFGTTLFDGTIPLILFVIGGFFLLLFTSVIIWLGDSYYLRASAWRNALTQLPQGVVIFDNDKQMLFKNDPASLLLKQLDKGALERVHQAGTQGSYNAVVKGREGASIQMQAWALEEKRGVVLTMRNIEQEQNQQQRIVSSYQELIHRLSHELYNPLRTMSLQLENAIHENANRQQDLQAAQDESGRLIRLVANLLTLSRLEVGQPLQRRPMKINTVAEDAVSQLVEMANTRQMTLDIAVDENLPLVKIDHDRWMEVFLNLIENAIKYGKVGGTVQVEIRRQSASGLQISIADDGQGISAEDLPHLFDDLYRGSSSRNTNGSGLGLGIVRRIIEQHGGQIHCESEPGHGATFHITLPVGD